LQFFFTLLVVVVLAFILLLFLQKAGRQLQYLRLKRGEESGKVADFWQQGWQDARQRQERWQAFLLFPMLYPIQLDDEVEALNDLKREVKRLHILIYFMLIIMILLSIFSEKIF